MNDGSFELTVGSESGAGSAFMGLLINGTFSSGFN